jgi:MFS family permease
MRGVRVVILASAAALFCAGMFNVAELPFARQELDASDVGFGVLVAAFGVGFVGGSLRGSGGGDSARLVRRFLLGLMLMGAALVCLAAVSAFALALVVFVVAGFGNGFVLVYERLFIQRTVPDELLGRVFGIKDGLTAWAFALAFLAAGGLLDGIGIRPMFVVAGSLGLVVWLVASHALRGLGSGPDVSRAQADARTAAAERAGV